MSIIRVRRDTNGRDSWHLSAGSDLHASPDAPISRAEAAVALAAYFGEKLDRDKAIRAAIDRGWMETDHRNWFHPDLPLL